MSGREIFRGVDVSTGAGEGIAHVQRGLIASKEGVPPPHVIVLGHSRVLHSGEGPRVCKWSCAESSTAITAFILIKIVSARQAVSGQVCSTYSSFDDHWGRSAQIAYWLRIRTCVLPQAARAQSVTALQTRYHHYLHGIHRSCSYLDKRLYSGANPSPQVCGCCKSSATVCQA